MEKVLRNSITFTFLVLSLTVLAPLAQGANPCEDDIARFCSNLAPGMGRIADCLKQHEAELSPGCKEQHLAEVGDALRQANQACGDDIVKFCGGYMQTPDEHLLNCLKTNAPSLSPDCRASLFKALELMQY